MVIFLFSSNFQAMKILYFIMTINSLTISFHLYKEYQPTSNLSPPPKQSIKKYYVYEWPEHLVNLWPKLNRSTSDIKLTSHLNYGTGAILNQSIGLSDTFQFGLFKLFHRRALIDYRRTFNPKEATRFFIPYDSAMDAIVNRKGLVRTPGCPRAREVIELLSASPYFRRNYGHDHFLIHSGNQCLGAMNNKPGCRQFLGFVCENCTKLGIETLNNCGESPHWHAIPFSSNIHWSTKVTTPPWSDYLTPRKYAVSFTGTTFSYSKSTRILRSKMREECQLHPSDCVMNMMSSHSSSSTTVDWTIPSSSTFCLTPPGDLPTRKGFFDTLLMGCIPVISDPYSAHEQWTWNLGLEYALSMTHFIPYERIISSNESFLKELIRLHEEQDEVIMKRFVISKYASRLQYRLPEGDYQSLPFTYSNDPFQHPDMRLSPPIDAFDIIIDRILNEIEDMKEMVAHPTDRGDWKGTEIFEKYPLGRTVTNFTHGIVPCLLSCFHGK